MTRRSKSKIKLGQGWGSRARRDRLVHRGPTSTMRITRKTQSLVRALLEGRRKKEGERERERERERDSFAAVSEQFKDTARTSSTRIKVAGTGSGARRYVAQIHVSVYFWSTSESLCESLENWSRKSDLYRKDLVSFYFNSNFLIPVRRKYL